MGHPVERWLRFARLGEPGRADEATASVFRRWIGPIVRTAYRPTFEGVHNLPETGAYLLVANHSAGLGLAEIGAFIVSWLERFGTSRPIAGMAHVFAFAAFPTSRLLPAIGAIPSTRSHVESALRAGVPILAFPGGDHETLRPLWQAHRVDLGGRKGFLKIARAAGVPIIPMGIRGSHFTAPVLFRIPRVLTPLLVFPLLAGASRWSVSLLAFVGVALVLVLGHRLGAAFQAALCWVIIGSPLGFLPWFPAKIRMRIGAPMPSSSLFPAGDGDEDLDAAYARVVGALQALVDAQRPSTSREA